MGHGESGKHSLSLTSPSGAPLPVVGFHLRTTSKRRSTPFLPACTASTSTIRPGACWKSCVSPSQGINLIHGTRMHMTPEPISGFVLRSVCHQTQTGGSRWITDVNASDLGVPLWPRLGHIGMCMQRKVLSIIQKTLSGRTLTSREPGRRLFLSNQRASLKRVWIV